MFPYRLVYGISGRTTSVFAVLAPCKSPRDVAMVVRAAVNADSRPSCLIKLPSIFVLPSHAVSAVMEDVCFMVPPLLCSDVFHFLISSPALTLYLEAIFPPTSISYSYAHLGPLCTRDTGRKRPLPSVVSAVTSRWEQRYQPKGGFGGGRLSLTAEFGRGGPGKLNTHAAARRVLLHMYL